MTKYANMLADCLRREAADRRTCMKDIGGEDDILDAAGVEDLAALVEALPDADPHLKRLSEVGYFSSGRCTPGRCGNYVIANLIPDRSFASLELFLDTLVAVAEMDEVDVREHGGTSAAAPRRARCEALASHLRELGDWCCQSALDSRSSWEVSNAAMLFDAADLADSLSDYDERIVAMARARYFTGRGMTPGPEGDLFLWNLDDEEIADADELLAGLAHAASKDAEGATEVPTDEAAPSNSAFLAVLETMSADDLQELCRLRLLACMRGVESPGQTTYPEEAQAMKSIIHPYLRGSGWLDLPEETKQAEATKVYHELPQTVRNLMKAMFEEDEGEYDIALGWALNQPRPRD